MESLKRIFNREQIESEKVVREVSDILRISLEFL